MRYASFAAAGLAALTGMADLVSGFNETNPIEADSIIISDCHSINGNGFNWASTLSYLAEKLSIQARQATDLAESSGKPVYVYNNCIIGGSSGSAVVGMWLNLLKNENLVPEVYTVDSLVAHDVELGDVRVYSPEQVAVLADAMRFTAMGVDFSADENTYLSAEYLTSAVLNSRNDPQWWSQVLDPYPIQVLFIEHGLALRNARLSDYEDTTAEDAIRQFKGTWEVFNFWSKSYTDTLVEVAKANGLQNVLDILKAPDNYKEGEVNDILKRLGQYTQRQHHKINQRVYDDSAAKYYLRLVNPSIRKDTPLNTMLKEELDDGFCTMAMSRVYDNMDEMDMLTTNDALPDYEEVRPVVACNKNTIQVILNSAKYQEDVKVDEILARYVFVSVNTYFDAFNFGVREPNTFAVMAGEMRDLGMTSYYDPRADIDGTFEPISTADGNGAIGVFGGYASGNMMAVPLAYYTDGLRNAFSGKVESVSASQHLFNKDTPPEFALTVIKELLCGDKDAAIYPDEVEKNLEDWENFDLYFSATIPQRFSSWSEVSSTIQTQPFEVNWDVDTSIPPCIGGTSWTIIPRSIVAARESLDSAREYTNIYVPGGEPEKLENVSEERDQLSGATLWVNSVAVTIIVPFAYFAFLR